MHKRPIALIVLILVLCVGALQAQTPRVTDSPEPKLIGYFCSSHGQILSQFADKSYTHVIIAFVAPNQDTGQMGFVCHQGVHGELILSTSVSASIRTLQQNNIKVLLSFGGGTVSSESYAARSNWVPSLARELAGIVQNCPTQDGAPIRFDGLDIDWEDTSAFTGQAVYDGRAFLIELTKELRKPDNLPTSAGYILTHTPQPPYLADHHTGMNGYIDIWNEVGDLIDWLQMQYYDNPGYQSSEQLLQHYRAATRGWSKHGSREAFAGIPSHKLLVGKPIIKRDAGSGYVPVEELIRETIKPLMNEYGDQFGGVFAWQILHDTDGVWSDKIAKVLFE